MKLMDFLNKSIEVLQTNWLLGKICLIMVFQRLKTFTYFENVVDHYLEVKP